jgi:HPr kinase/phosphorylase
MRIEATVVAVDGRALLLRGPSGAGKSDLALRLIRAGARLIADDAVELAEDNGRLLARAIAGATNRLAVRGIGLVPVASESGPVPLSLCIALCPAPLTSLAPPLGDAGPWFGLVLPEVALFPFEESAVDKALLALDRFGL